MTRKTVAAALTGSALLFGVLLTFAPTAESQPSTDTPTTSSSATTLPPSDAPTSTAEQESAPSSSAPAETSVPPVVVTEVPTDDGLTPLPIPDETDAPGWTPVVPSETITTFAIKAVQFQRDILTALGDGLVTAEDAIAQARQIFQGDILERQIENITNTADAQAIHVARQTAGGVSDIAVIDGAVQGTRTRVNLSIITASTVEVTADSGETTQTSATTNERVLVEVDTQSDGASRVARLVYTTDEVATS